MGFYFDIEAFGEEQYPSSTACAVRPSPPFQNDSRDASVNIHGVAPRQVEQRCLLLCSSRFGPVSQRVRQLSAQRGEHDVRLEQDEAAASLLLTIRHQSDTRLYQFQMANKRTSPKIPDRTLQPHHPHPCSPSCPNKPNQLKLPRALHFPPHVPNHQPPQSPSPTTSIEFRGTTRYGTHPSLPSPNPTFPAPNHLIGLSCDRPAHHAYASGHMTSSIALTLSVNGRKCDTLAPGCHVARCERSV